MNPFIRHLNDGQPTVSIGTQDTDDIFFYLKKIGKISEHFEATPEQLEGIRISNFKLSKLEGLDS